MIIQLQRAGSQPRVYLAYLYYRSAARGGAKQKFCAALQWATASQQDQIGFILNICSFSELSDFDLPSDWTVSVVSSRSTLLHKVHTLFKFRKQTLITDFSPNLSPLISSHWWLIHDVRAGLGYKSLYKKWLYLFQVQVARSFLTVSKFTESEIRRIRLDNGKAATFDIYKNGITNDFWEIPRAKKKRYDVISVGQFDHRKSHLDLIKALTSLDKKGYTLRIAFIGQTGNAFDAVTREIGRFNRERNSSISIFTEVDHTDLLKFYSESSISVHCSRYEGFGISVLEGAAAGQIVVASDIPAHKEIAPEGVIFFRTGNIIDLAAALDRALHTRQTTQRRFVSVPTWEQVCNDFWSEFLARK